MPPRDDSGAEPHPTTVVSLLSVVLRFRALILVLALLGAFYAGTDGVLMALASARLPEDLRTSGMALLMSVSNLARLGASILFGWLWTWRGVEFAVGAFGSALVVATALTAVLLRSGKAGSSNDRLASS